MTHVQPGVGIYLTRGKAKCFVSTCGVAADDMRTSEASSMIVFASALVLTFCVAFPFLFFSSLPFFVGDFFSCFFLLQVNLRAANRRGWQVQEDDWTAIWELPVLLVVSRKSIDRSRVYLRAGQLNYNNGSWIDGAFIATRFVLR